MFNAAYDCGPRAELRCFEGTRVQVVEKIKRWAKDPSGRQIGWLTGPAGYGKSTIVRTVALQWDLDKLLAASYFFFRNAGHHSMGAWLLPTLAFQLTSTIPETKGAIEDALAKDPGLRSRNLEHQFQRLLIDPILALPQQNRYRRFIVIDALDECDGHDFIPQFVKLITRIDYSTFPVQFLFTSRRDEHINRAFADPPTDSMTYHLSLSDVDANPDIKLFLRSCFDIIHTENPLVMANIPKPWPSPSDLDEIVRKVNGSFIFAATLAKYIGTGSVPPERLKIVVDTHTGVDGMYIEIIKEFWNDEHFKTVFSTIILLPCPFSVTGLVSLLGLKRSEIFIEILKIQSILIVPSDDRTPVHIVHTSLRDFSISPKRAGSFCVEIKLFLRSRFDIIHTENPRIMANIPKPWPSPSDLDEIVRKVNGWFILAATLAKYIGTGRAPPERLKSAVEIHTGLDGAYIEIMNEFCNEFWNDELFQTVFSTIMLLQRPFSVFSLARLLNLTPSEILIEILKIQSIAIIPSDVDTPVDIVHASLRDFSISPTRTGRFCVGTPEHHLSVVERCLEVMLVNSEQVVFDEDPMIYAASFWHKHLLLTLNADSYGLQYDSLVNRLEIFTRQAADTWSNTFILNGDFGDFKSSIDDIRRAVKVSPNLEHSIFSILNAQATAGFPPRAVRVINQLRNLLEVSDTVPSGYHVLKAPICN